MAEAPPEVRRNPHVVPHPDPPRELDVAPGPRGAAGEPLGLREAEEDAHPLEGNPTLHPPMPALGHVRRTDPFP